MTLLPWREHPLAREEYLGALDWYDEREPGFGARLADELDAAVDFVREWPDASPRVSGRHARRVLRRKSVGVFPYAVVYLVLDDEVVIVAYAHERRRPAYWRSRLGSL